MLLVYMTLYMKEYLILQLILLSLSTIFVMMVLGNRPHQELRQNYMITGLAGEAAVLIIQDLLLFSTDPLVIPEHRDKIGLCIMIVMGLNILFAVTPLIIESIQESKRQCKIK